MICLLVLNLHIINEWAVEPIHQVLIRHLLNIHLSPAFSILIFSLLSHTEYTQINVHFKNLFNDKIFNSFLLNKKSKCY